MDQILNDEPYRDKISFSGVDYKAIVYLPVNKEYVDSKLTQMTAELQLLQTRKTSLVGMYENYSSQYLSASDADKPQVLREWNAFKTRYGLSTTSFGNILSDVEALGTEIARLQNLSHKGDKFTLPIVLGDLQTLSISTHREKAPVRTLGRIYPHAYTRGTRTLAGSLIFTVMNRHALYELLEAHTAYANTGVKSGGGSYPALEAALVDQLGPFDITILGSNEVGDNSYAVLYGVEIVNEGQTLSIEDLITECVMQFVARDYEPLRPLTERRTILQAGEPVLTATDILRQGEARRRKQRANRFI